MFSRCLEGLISDPCTYVGERSAAKKQGLISLLSMVSKVFEKRVNKKIVDLLEKCGLFFFALWF